MVQRHQDGRIHFHLVVVMAQDIRTGFDFDAVARRDYSSASAYLRAEWKHLRECMPAHQFGRHELLPIKNGGGFGTYVARYVGRSIATRGEEKGARLVRYSKNFPRSVCGPFTKVDLIGARARRRVPRIAYSLGYRTLEAMERELGNSWKYQLRRLLFCDDTMFLDVITYVEVELRYCGGGLFHMEHRIKEIDAIRAFGRKFKQIEIAELKAFVEGVDRTRIESEAGPPIEQHAQSST